MNISAIKTPLVIAHAQSIVEILDAALPAQLPEGSVVAVTSKIVSICEGSIVPMDEIDKEDLVVQQADLYLPASQSKYGHHFTVTQNTLIAMAGIDESNGEGYYILWPRDAQQAANDIRQHLRERYGVKDVGVIITDSTCQPLRRGTTGIALAHSGFYALRNYVGTPDLFGRPFGITQANVMGGIAAAAVLAMGEGAEQTPICILTGVPTIVFNDEDPSAAELAELHISIEDDLFAPFLTAVDWKQGKRTAQEPEP